MMRPNKREHLSLETISNRVLEFEGKTRANPIGLHHPLDGITNPKYILLHFLTNKYFLQRGEGISF